MPRQLSLEERLGNIIREHRESLGLSQEAFAEKCDLHRTYISQLERGLKSPTVRTLALIADKLKLTPDELL
ncbi:MAG: helix-turn-helix transcriptional regulator, partial [Chloroflexota bacterium]